MASNFQKEEEIQEKDSIVIGKSAQDGVNMAIANAAGGEGFGYGQYLQVNNILQKITKKITRLGAIFILRKDTGVGGWSRKWQFSLTLCSENVLT